MKLVLEPRHLFDGSVAAVAAHAAHAADAHHRHDAAPQRHDPAVADTSNAALPHLHSYDLAALAPNPQANEILFVDPRVSDWQSLVASVGGNVQVVLLNPNEDGVAQVTAALQGRTDIASIQFLTYGAAGEVELGDTLLTSSTMASYAQQIASWGDHLASNADIEFWGCDIGQGASGQAFVDGIHALTGAQVGASTDATGSAALGGDWTLELTTGQLDVGAPFSAAAMAAYQGVLDAPDPVVTLSWPSTTSLLPSGDVLLGNTFTEILTFSNGAASAVGYAPFVEVFAPSNANQSVTLQSATYLGSAVTFQAVTLTTDANGNVGAVDPFVIGANGQAQFVDAPAGYQAGDTMYVLQLPFGSFTPGQPAAQVQLTFSMANTTQLSSTANLNISAIGGFQYGSDPLNDPGSDPSILGTTTAGAPQEYAAPTSSDGLATLAASVSLLDVQATTDLHEYETATGPDFPFNYVITLTPAPVTQTDPTGAVTFTFTLPDQVEYVPNGTISITGPGGATGTATFTADPSSVSGAGGTVTVTFSSLTTDASDTPTVIKIPVFVPQYDATGAAVLDPGGDARTVGALGYTFSGTWNGTAVNNDSGVDGAVTFSGSDSGGSISDGVPVDTAGAANDINLSAFTAKSLAIQVYETSYGLGGAEEPGNPATGTEYVTPGGTVQYTIDFQVSDYYALNNLNIANVLSDGLSLMPGDAPTLTLTSGGQTQTFSFGAITNGTTSTVNAADITETVAASGMLASSGGQNAGSTLWSYNRDTSNTGQTSINFAVGALLLSQAGAGSLVSVLEGGEVNGSDTGTTGTITFNAQVLQAYTSVNGQADLRERDTVSDTIATSASQTTGGISPTSATVVTVSGPGAGFTLTNSDVNTVTDDSAVTGAVEQGQMTVQVVAVNGQTADLSDIEAGDQVTYALTYQLPVGNYGDFNMTAYLPEPVFTTGDPNANGSNVSYTETAYSASSYPASGTYSFTGPISNGTTPTVTANSTANSINFDFGSYNNAQAAVGQSNTVTVYVTLTTTSTPFANGLFLTTEGQASYTNAQAATVTTANIVQIPMSEPEVAVKTGVVSVIGTGGSSSAGGTADPNASYSVDANDQAALTQSLNSDGTASQSVTWNQNAVPGSSPFAPAGTAVGTLFANGGTAAAANAADDLDASQVSAGDLVRIVSTVQNLGNGAAYDVTTNGTLPAGYTASDVTNFAIYNSSGQQIDTGVTAAQYFSAAGVQLVGSSGTNGQPASLAKGDSIYVVYDLQTPLAQQTAQSLTASSAILGFASAEGAQSFVSAGSAVGETAQAVSDSAAIDLISPAAPTLAVTGGDDAQLPVDASNNGNGTSVVPGETMTYTLTVNLPEGTTSNGGSDVTVSVDLPGGMTFGSLQSATLGGGVSNGGAAITGPASGSTGTITFDLGNALTSSNIDANGTVTLVYTATINATGQGDGHAYAQTATLNYQGASGAAAASPTGTVTVDEVDPNVGEAITVADPSGHAVDAGNPPYSNEVLTYTVTLTNNGDAIANSLSTPIVLPTGLTYVPGSLQVGSGAATNPTVSDASGLIVGAAQLGAGQSETYTFQATVDPNQGAGASLTVSTPSSANGASDTPAAPNPNSGTYWSMPGTSGTPAGGEEYDNSASATVQIAQLSTVLSIVGESNDTTPAPGTPEQDSTQTTATATVGEIVTLHAYVEVPEGENANQALTFTLPTGLEYLAGSATIAFVSPNGSLVSSTIDPSGNISGLQYQDSAAGANYVAPTTGTATAGNAATFAPTYDVPAGAITSSGGTLSIDLGTLSNNAGSATANYVLVQFNVVVQNVPGNANPTGSATGGTALSTTYSVGSATSNAATIDVVEPNVAISKTVTGIDNSTGTVTYTVSLQNTGASTAYDVTVDDPVVAGENGVAFVSATGGGAGGVDSSTASDFNYTIGSLAAGASETLTYTVQLATPTSTVQNDTATAVWQSLPGTQTLNGSTGTAVGTPSGGRDGAADAATDNPASEPYAASSTTNIDVATGQVWQALGADSQVYSQTGGSDDTPLAGVTVTAQVTEAGGTVVTETTTTDANGDYSLALPDGTVTITLPASGSSGLPASETLVYNSQTPGAGSPVASATITASGGSAQTDLDFVYQLPDTPPTISGWAGNAAGGDYTEGGAPVLLGDTASVSDAQLDALVAHGGDYSGTILTVQRYSGGTAAPSASDVFSAAAGSLLALNGGTLTYNGQSIGTYTEAGGVLTVAFGTGATATTVNEVLNNLAWSTTDSGKISTGIQIGATLNDGNTSNSQGTGGALTSAPAIVIVNEAPPSASATFQEPKRRRRVRPYSSIQRLPSAVPTTSPARRCRSPAAISRAKMCWWRPRRCPWA